MPAWNSAWSSSEGSEGAVVCGLTGVKEERGHTTYSPLLRGKHLICLSFEKPLEGFK